MYNVLSSVKRERAYAPTQHATHITHSYRAATYSLVRNRGASTAVTHSHGAAFGASVRPTMDGDSMAASAAPPQSATTT